MMEQITLSQAIEAVETAGGALSSADAVQAQAQAKYDAAKAAKDQADQASIVTAASFNSALDALISAATAAKVTRPAAV
jgi:predicted ribonuclease toxin of YeeF-YezG toxin-antitoxin module